MERPLDWWDHTFWDAHLPFGQFDTPGTLCASVLGGNFLTWIAEFELTALLEIGVGDGRILTECKKRNAGLSLSGCGCAPALRPPGVGVPSPHDEMFPVRNGVGNKSSIHVRCWSWPWNGWTIFRRSSPNNDLDPWRSDRTATAGEYADLYDHVTGSSEWTESLRDMLTALFETHLSLRDSQLNTVMKKLAGWAAGGQRWPQCPPRSPAGSGRIFRSPVRQRLGLSEQCDGDPREDRRKLPVAAQGRLDLMRQS